MEGEGDGHKQILRKEIFMLQSSNRHRSTQDSRFIVDGETFIVAATPRWIKIRGNQFPNSLVLTATRLQGKYFDRRDLVRRLVANGFTGLAVVTSLSSLAAVKAAVVGSTFSSLATESVANFVAFRL